MQRRLAASDVASVATENGQRQLRILACTALRLEFTKLLVEMRHAVGFDMQSKSDVSCARESRLDQQNKDSSCSVEVNPEALSCLGTLCTCV